MTEAITNQLAEIIGAVHESITALSAVSRQQHLVHLYRHSRDEAILSSDNAAVAYFKREKEKTEKELATSEGELVKSLRKLEAIKLILEGKTTEEIRDMFAGTDAVLAGFKEKIADLASADR
jgi:hypothetical protein